MIGVKKRHLSWSREGVDEKKVLENSSDLGKEIYWKVGKQSIGGQGCVGEGDILECGGMIDRWPKLR